ncbi:uncharacterized protein [Apostichopus japonicus]|uniref:uncharacterized protein isoform X2 n=1 Tax=Stichopus japonicus TaxID=307972 RepID=UPI003AB7DB26
MKSLRHFASKRLFELMNSLMKPNCDIQYPPTISLDELSNDFGDYFMSKIDKIRDELDNDDVPDICRQNIAYSATPSFHSFSVLSEEDVRALLCQSPRKHCVNDPIPTWLLKECAEVILPFLTMVINMSLQHGYFPPVWKNAVVTPILKKPGAENVFSNYRPLFMAAVWSVFQLMVVLFYFDLPFLSDLPAEVRQKVEANGTGVMSSPSEDEITRPLTPKQLTNVLDDDAIDESDRNNHNEYGTAQMSQVQKPTALTMKQKLMVLLREEIVVMLATSFIFFFNQTALEACMTPLTKQFLGVKSFGNSLFFCLAGAEVIVGFVLISKLSKRCQDRLILTIGLLIEIGALIFLCVFLPMSANGRIKTRSINWIWLTMIFMVQVAGLPFILIANVSLLSKLVPEEIQGFSQGVRRSIMGLGTIMGPLWGAGALTVPVSFSTVMVILFIIVQTMVFCSWDKLAEPRQVDQKNHTRITSGTSQRGTSSERTSLLNEHD